MLISRVIVILTAVTFLIASCAGVNYLRTEHIKNSDEVEGAFTLIIHGAKFEGDLETVAILDREGDEYELKPFSSEFRYKVTKNIPAEKALEEAYHFVRAQASVNRTWLKRVLSKDGEVIGYEIRPLYMPFVHGEQDVVEVSYVLREGKKVRVYIRMKNSVDISGEGEGDAYIWGG